MAPRRKTIRVTHRFPVSAERVFDAWIDPAHACRWLFATDTGKNVRCDIDARVGGQFVIVDRRPEGDAEHVGTFLEIDRPRMLVFEFSVPQYSQETTRITVEISPIDGECEVSLSSDNILPDYAQRTEQGWSTILAALARELSPRAE